MKVPVSTPGAILIATIGTKPQVVTTALDLLLAARNAIPQVIVLHPPEYDPAMATAIANLRTQFAAHPAYSAINLECVPVADVDDPSSEGDDQSSVEQVFRTIYQTVLSAKRAGSRVHFSIVGGRKVFAVYGMATAQLLFDDADCLWYVLAGGRFLTDERWHPEPGDLARLVPIPVLRWGTISPVLTDLNKLDDPFAAVDLQRERHLRAQLDEARSFVLGSLTGAQQKAVALLVQDGLGDVEIAERLSISVRTVERHLGEAYAKASAHWELESVNRTQLVALLGLYYALDGGPPS